MFFYLDIETTYPNDQETRDAIAATIKAPGNYTKPESIAKWMEENAATATQEKLEALSLNGMQGMITAIGYSIVEFEMVRGFAGVQPDVGKKAAEHVDVLAVTGNEDPLMAERSVLNAFRETLEVHDKTLRNGPWKYIGHSIVSFDLRFIWQRCMVHGIALPRWFPRHTEKNWSDKIIDLQYWWNGGNGFGGSAAKIAAALGIENPDTLTGADMPKAFWNGDFGAIAIHCRHDIELAKKIHQRMIDTCLL